MMEDTVVTNREIVDAVAWRTWQFMVKTCVVLITFATVLYAFDPHRFPQLPPLIALIVLFGLMIIDHAVTYVWCYGFRRRTVDEHWDERRDSSLATRDRWNRQATILWLLGFKRHALNLIERADDAWVDAHLASVHEEQE